MSLNQFLFSLFLVSVGFTTFYYIPQAFLEQRFTMLFLLLNMILILNVVGLTFLCTLVFAKLESMLLWLTLNVFCKFDKNLFAVVSKNMEAHSVRNTNTSIMFTMTISFLIFSSSSFKLLAGALSKIRE